MFANTATPLNAKERGGDLSATGGTAPVDPLNNVVAFPGRVIPVNRIDPVAKKILDTYIPFPNLLANGAFEAQIPHPKDTDEVLFKLDHNINQAHRLTGSLFYTTGLDSVGLLGNIPWVTRDFSWRQYNYNVAETWIVSPTMINQATLTYVRNFGGRVNTPADLAGRPRFAVPDSGRAFAAADLRWRGDSISTARFPARWRAAISTSFATSSASAPPSTRCAWEARRCWRRWCTIRC